MTVARDGLFFVLLVASVPAAALAQPAESVARPAAAPHTLSLADLEQIALGNNPTLNQAAAQIRLSRGKAIQAGLLPNPRTGYVAEQIGTEGTAGELHGLFVEQQFVTGGKLALSRSKFAQEARQAELQLLAQQFRVIYGVRLAFYEALVWQRRVAVRQQAEKNAAEGEKTVRELVNVGQANRPDLLQAQIALRQAAAATREATLRWEASQSELAAVVGWPDLRLTALHGDLELQTDSAINREEALNNLLVSSPQLAVARAEVLRDRIGVQRERVEPIPNVDLRAETGYNFESNDTVAGAQIGLRLPVFDRNQGTILQARAELARAQAEVSRVELQLRQQFARTFAEYEAARFTAASYRDEMLPQADEMRRLYMESFQQRRAAWPQVVGAEREYLELYERYLDELLAARRAEARIACFFLEEGLAQPPEPTPEGHRDSVPKPR